MPNDEDKSSENQSEYTDQASLEAPEDNNQEEASSTEADASSDEQPAASSNEELAAPPSSDGLAQPPGSQPGGQSPKAPKKRLAFLRGANLYLIGFIVIVLIAIGVVIFAFKQGQSNNQPKQISSQNLSADSLKQLASSDVTVGDSKQLLTVQSNAIFAGQILAQKNLEVAGNLKIGGNLSLPSIVVGGTSQFGSVQINKELSVAGKTSVQGDLTVQGSLSVRGGANFSGPLSAPQVTASSLQLNGDLTLIHHISAGGSTPGSSRGSAVGGGGSATVSGSDSAGGINISTGGSPPAGCFITVNFTQAFHATPHVVITPIGSAAGRLSYYVNRSTTSFSVCTATPAPGGANFGFDYIVFD